jgi:zinc ribbon protein
MSASSCRRCGQPVQADWRFCRSCGAPVEPPIEPSTGRPSPQRPVSSWAPVLGGWLIGALVTLAVMTGLVLLVAFVLAPLIVRSTPIVDLRRAARAVVLLLYSTNLSAGVAGGTAGALFAARRQVATRRGGVTIAVTGAATAAGALLVVALVRGYSTPAKVEVPSGLLLLLGSLLGAALALRSYPRTVPRAVPPPPSRREPGAGAMALALLMLFAGLPGTHPSTRPAPLPSGSLVMDTANPWDIGPDECTERSTADKIKGFLTIASVDLGGAFTYQKKLNGAGKWSVKVSTGGEVGLKFLEGAKLTTPLIKRTLSLEASGHLTVESAQKYDVPSEDEADRLIRWAMVSDLSKVFGFGTLGTLLQSIAATQLYGSGFTPPDPKSREFQVGGSVKVEFQAALGGAEGKLSLGLDSGLGITIKPPDDPKNVTIFAKIGASGTAKGTPASLGNEPSTLLKSLPPSIMDQLTAGIGGELEGDTMLSLSVDKKSILGQPVLVPKSISIEASGGYKGEADFSGTKGAFKELADKLNGLLGKGTIKKLGAGLSTTEGRTLQFSANVDFEKHPDALISLAAFLTAAEADSKDGSTADDHARLRTAARDLADRFDREATVSLVTFDTGSTNAKFDAAFGEGLAFGLGASFTLSDQALSQADFRDPLLGFVQSQSCRPSQT